MMEDLSVELEHGTEGTVCIWRIYHYRKNNRHRNSLYIKNLSVKQEQRP